MSHSFISKKNVTTPLRHKSQKISYIMICYANVRVADPLIYFIFILHLLKDLGFYVDMYRTIHLEHKMFSYWKNT